MADSDRAGQTYELLVVCGDKLEIFPLPQAGIVSLGRAANNLLRIDHPSVSRNHARFELGDRVVVEDLGGSNGTFVRAAAQPQLLGQTQQLQRLTGARAEIRVGEPLLLGAVSAVLRRSGPAAGHDSLSPAPPGAAAYDFEPRSPAMSQVYTQAKRAAAASISVLVLGETGVGKEVLARAIHATSPRRERPFMAINCAALGDSLLEGELFGYERGAFTGAVQARPGLFEAADGGSVFLDEIGDLPLTTQVKLLRVLEDRSVLRIGSRSARSIDVRIIAATHRDLEAEVRSGGFRQDLLYRLNAIVLVVPPLRERAEEIADLAQTFLASACKQLDRPLLGISAGAMQILLRHAWPGNVRELRNALERAAVLCTDGEILADHLPRFRVDGPDRASARAQVKGLERDRVVEALKECSGNQTRAARLLGMSRRTLVSRLDELGLPRPKKRPV